MLRILKEGKQNVIKVLKNCLWSLNNHNINWTRLLGHTVPGRDRILALERGPAAARLLLALVLLILNCNKIYFILILTKKIHNYFLIANSNCKLRLINRLIIKD